MVQSKVGSSGVTILITDENVVLLFLNKMEGFMLDSHLLDTIRKILNDDPPVLNGDK